MRHAGRVAVLLAAGLATLAVVAAPTSGLAVDDGMPAFDIKAATGDKAGKQFCMV